MILSRRAIRNLNTLYPDATAEDLANTDTVCIICREEMVTGILSFQLNFIDILLHHYFISGAKKLPCNHIFHATCLRSWFQRQQTCPTCRLEVLRAPGQPNVHPQAPPPAAANIRPAQPQPATPAPPQVANYI